MRRLPPADLRHAGRPHAWCRSGAATSRRLIVARLTAGAAAAARSWRRPPPGRASKGAAQLLLRCGPATTRRSASTPRSATAPSARCSGPTCDASVRSSRVRRCCVLPVDRARRRSGARMAHHRDRRTSTSTSIRCRTAGGEEPVAQRLATVAEDVYARLTPVSGKGLGRKTHVVLTDDIDDYNGFADVYPYPRCALYANSPDDRAELNDYDDWLTDAVHARVHAHPPHRHHRRAVRHGGQRGPRLRARHRLSRPTSRSRASSLEGLAVFEETARTSRRAAAQLDLGHVPARADARGRAFSGSTSSPTSRSSFRTATRPTCTARRCMRFVAEHYGEDALRRMSRDYGSVCIPGGDQPRAPPRDRQDLGRELYDEFRAELTRRYRRSATRSRRAASRRRARSRAAASSARGRCSRPTART